MPERSGGRSTRRWLMAACLVLASMLGETMLDETTAFAAWSCADKDKHTLEQTQPLNIGQLKSQLRDYRHCGGYDADFANRAAEAKAYIQQRAPQADRPA